MGILRLLLALSVLAAHSTPILGVRLISGGAAVHLFFVISGFYMALILTGKYHDHQTFYVNRFLRLWPTYLVVLIAGYAWYYFCWSYTGQKPPPFWLAQAYEVLPWWQALMLRVANFSMLGLDIPFNLFYQPSVGLFFIPFNTTAPDGAYWAYRFVEIGPAWSISMEIWFYLLAPLLVRRRLAILMALIVASAALNLSGDFIGLPTYFFFPAQLYLFITGIVVYRFYEGHRSMIDAHRAGPAILGIVVAAFLCYRWIPAAWGPFVISAVCVPALPWLFACFRDSRWDSAIGNLSYPIYVCHVLVGTMLATAFDIDNGTVLAGVSVAVSTVLHLVIEKPINRYRQALAGSNSKFARQHLEPVTPAAMPVSR
ncbi:acyltransferase [Reyranella sp.]|uniref:acyltransferase family protein n=1 Tax=Reyranella sp. TaxID=1929291 RepID=UPI00272F738F|nr:acyltransferase [Reyranella sp.]MDP2377810.1 acyltransferase [Reyranella sp.]